MSTPWKASADVSVRPAISGDEATIAAIQVAAWRLAHADTLGADALDLLDAEVMVARWKEAIEHSPGPGHHVLVAVDGPRLVGVVSLAPVPAAPDADESAPGGVILALEVLPAAQRGGHGSRLLAAAVDTLRADGADQVITWVLDGDEARVRFLDGAGLGPDGTVRDLASGPGPGGDDLVVRERRWGARI